MAEAFAARHGEVLWVMMITSAENAGWPDDMPVAESPSLSGLRTASIIRPAKIAAIDAAEAELIGCISEPLWEAVAALVRSRLR